MTINVHNDDIYLQYVFYYLLVHIIISYHSSYVLVMVLYMAQLALLKCKEKLTFPNYKGDFTQV